MSERISIGFSPCPNDTYIFDALVNNKIDTHGLTFDVVMEDVETLNQWALQHKLAVSKVSYGVLPSLTDNYRVLTSGGALGRGVGPLLISGVPGDADIEERAIAIPGEHTTAHRLFKIFYPGARNKVFMRYDRIEDFVASKKGLGVIIHESRFTYRSRGLHKVADLGELWEERYDLPIPLGAIVCKRDLVPKKVNLINSLIRESIRYANKNYPALPEFVSEHAQEMNEEVMRKHIELYVNEYSQNLGKKGREAVRLFLGERIEESIFVD